MNTCNSCYALASFPGSVQLSVASSTVQFVLEATESWAGPGNEAVMHMLLACSCNMYMLHARAWHMLHVWLHVVITTCISKST